MTIYTTTGLLDIIFCSVTVFLLIDASFCHFYFMDYYYVLNTGNFESIFYDVLLQLNLQRRQY